MMRAMRTALALLAVIGTLAACGGDDGDDEPDALATGFCADLESGMSVAQILASAGDDVEFDGTQDAAANVAIWVEEACPEQLATNDELTGFLDANAIPYSVPD